MEPMEPIEPMEPRVDAAESLMEFMAPMMLPNESMNLMGWN
jgi:hypothetical protein